MATKRAGSHKRAKATSAVFRNPTIAVAANNLLNMAAVAAASATILLCLMVFKQF